MPLKTRFMLAVLLVLLATLFTILFTPSAVSNGIRLWAWWKGRQEGLRVNIDKIDAPFLRPVVVRGFHITNARDDGFRINFSVTEARLDLNFKHILLRIRGRAIRNLLIQQLHGELRLSYPARQVISRGGWKTLVKLLPRSLAAAGSDIRIEDGPTLILLRKGFLSASETEAGRFSADELMIASPWFRQTFSQLRGATNWQDNRLTLAGLTLTRGLDLQTITADLSRLGNQRVGLEFDADAFGGKIRGNLSHEWRSQHANWKIAGSGTDISLAQTSEALGFTDHIQGLLRACNFTFHGNLGEPARATASLWTELTGLTWRNRTAEAIMLGAVLYNRQVQLQQLYIKQKANQLTLSGETSSPSNASDWLAPDFRGDISASINQLGDFAALFGANPGDFAGKIAVEGTVNARDRKIGGHLTLDGAPLTLFKTAIDSLSAKLNLKATELEIEQFDLKHKNDFLTTQGKIDMSHEHNYSGTLTAAVDNLADYLSIFRGPAENKSKPTPVKIQIAIASNKWDAHGVIGLPGSSPVSFIASFPLPIGTSWNAFFVTPLNVTLDFPSIFLSSTPQFFHPEIFGDGILSGRLSLSQTLQHPHVGGDVQLLKGKLQASFLNLTEASTHITFNGDHASINFFNAATNDVDLSLYGEISFPEINDLAVKLVTATPILDLTLGPVSCVGKIEIEPVMITLAPEVAELDVRGGLFQSDWSIGLKERISGQFVASLALNGTARKFPVCSLDANGGEKTLLLGTSRRPEAHRQAIRPKKRAKRR
jgi:hypothetical protein